MSKKLEGKICPFLKKECLSSGCALYDERLDNCMLSLLTYNLYRLFCVLKENDNERPKRFPF